MLLSRKKSKAPASSQASKKSHKPKLDDFLSKRDYTGAVSLLDFNRQTNQEDEKYPTLPWLAYCCFHLGDFHRAMEIYKEMLKEKNCPPTVHVYLGCCYYFLGMYKESEEEVLKGPAIPLQNRVLFHTAHKFNDDSKLMKYHSRIQGTIEDQLCLGAIHYFRNHYQEATDIYKRILVENRDFLALNVYIALCYYKLDYYDVSLEVLNVFLQSNPDSAIALNLKAANHYRLYGGKSAETELRALREKQSSAFASEDVISEHNMVAYQGGENALQVFPRLIGVIPEASLNLAIYYLKNNEIDKAYDMLKDVEPSSPTEYVLKGVVNTFLGQQKNSKENLKLAQQFFQIVGSSASERDTIPGRQCMASCFFLLRQFDDVMVYLNSIKSFFAQDDSFNWNYGVALSETGKYSEAIDAFMQVKSEEMRNEYTYAAWLARCYIMTGKPDKAWDIYLNMETSTEAFNLIQLIANDCYKMKSFFYAAKAFDVLERLDPDSQYWEGKRGACVGVFQQIMEGKERKEALRDIITLMRNANKPEVNSITRVMKWWAQEYGVKIV